MGTHIRVDNAANYLLYLKGMRQEIIVPDINDEMEEPE